MCFGGACFWERMAGQREMRPVFELQSLARLQGCGSPSSTCGRMLGERAPCIRQGDAKRAVPVPLGLPPPGRHLRAHATVQSALLLTGPVSAATLMLR